MSAKNKGEVEPNMFDEILILDPPPVSTTPCASAAAATSVNASAGTKPSAANDRADKLIRKLHAELLNTRKERDSAHAALKQVPTLLSAYRREMTRRQYDIKYILDELRREYMHYVTELGYAAERDMFSITEQSAALQLALDDYKARWKEAQTASKTKDATLNLLQESLDCEQRRQDILKRDLYLAESELTDKLYLGSHAVCGSCKARERVKNAMAEQIVAKADEIEKLYKEMDNMNKKMEQKHRIVEMVTKTNERVSMENKTLKTDLAVQKACRKQEAQMRPAASTNDTKVVHLTHCSLSSIACTCAEGEGPSPPTCPDEDTETESPGTCNTNTLDPAPVTHAWQRIKKRPHLANSLSSPDLCSPLTTWTLEAAGSSGGKQVKGPHTPEGTPPIDRDKDPLGLQNIQQSLPKKAKLQLLEVTQPDYAVLQEDPDWLWTQMEGAQVLLAWYRDELRHTIDERDKFANHSEEDIDDKEKLFEKAEVCVQKVQQLTQEKQALQQRMEELTGLIQTRDTELQHLRNQMSTLTQTVTAYLSSTSARR